LEGAKRTIAEQQPIVVVEFNPKALTRAGFECRDILRHFSGWDQQETYRFGDENWDIMFTPPH
jgi:hypothetical protein